MMGHATFSKEVFASFRSNDRDGPIQMLNLIKLPGDGAQDGRG
jgi:hypothetical protein